MVILLWALISYMIGLPFILIGLGEYLLAFTFYVNAIPIAYMARQCLVRNFGGPAYATVSLFMLMFMYVAPIYQLLEFPGFLVNNYTPSMEQMVTANIMVFLFTSIFIVWYARRAPTEHVPVLKVDDGAMEAMLPLITIISVVMAVIAIGLAAASAVDVSTDDADVSGSIGIAIVQKVGLVIPFFAFGFYLSRRRQYRSLLVVGFLLLLVLASKNPFIDRRNALGPIYLSVVFLLLWQGRIGSRSVFALFGSALLIVFPITAIFINNRPDTWADVVTLDNMVTEVRNHFTDLHYDAWAELVSMMEFVRTEGFQLGHQLLGSLLFFVPRAIWADKPISSGQELGEYLVQSHGLWFTNISTPLPAEGYIDFGIVGVVAFAVLLAWYAQRLDFFVNRGSAVDRTSALYFAFYLTFVMRGSLLPAVAYGVGAYFALNVIPLILSKLTLRSQRQVGAGMPATARF